MKTSEDFKKYYHLTPMQLRDMYLEEACFSGNVTTDVLRDIKNLGAEEQARRKADGGFVECPYCKGYHDRYENNDRLCDKCEWTVHILRWDAAYKKPLDFL
jgi:hypothetical protein